MPYIAHVQPFPIRENEEKNYWIIGLGIDFTNLTEGQKNLLQAIIRRALAEVGGFSEQVDLRKTAYPRTPYGKIVPEVGEELLLYLPKQKKLYDYRLVLTNIWKELENQNFPLICKTNFSKSRKITFKNSLTPFSTKNHEEDFLTTEEEFDLFTPLENTYNLYKKTELKNAGSEAKLLEDTKADIENSANLPETYSIVFGKHKQAILDIAKEYFTKIADAKNEQEKSEIRNAYMAKLRNDPVLKNYPRRVDRTKLEMIDIELDPLLSFNIHDLKTFEELLSTLHTQITSRCDDLIRTFDLLSDPNLRLHSLGESEIEKNIEKAIFRNPGVFLDRCRAIQAYYNSNTENLREVRSLMQNETVAATKKQRVTQKVDENLPTQVRDDLVVREKPEEAIADIRLVDKLKKSFHEVYFDPNDPVEKDRAVNRLAKETGFNYFLKALFNLPNEKDDDKHAMKKWSAIHLNPFLGFIPLIKRVVMLLTEVLPALADTTAEHLASKCNRNHPVGFLGFGLFTLLSWTAKLVRQVGMRFSSPQRGCREGFALGMRLGNYLAGVKEGESKTGTVIGYLFGGTSALVSVGLYVGTAFVAGTAILGLHVFAGAAAGITLAAKAIASVTGPVFPWLGIHITAGLAAIGIKLSIAAITPSTAAVISVATGLLGTLATCGTRFYDFCRGKKNTSEPVKQNVGSESVLPHRDVRSSYESLHRNGVADLHKTQDKKQVIADPSGSSKPSQNNKPSTATPPTTPIVERISAGPTYM